MYDHKEERERLERRQEEEEEEEDIVTVRDQSSCLIPSYAEVCYCLRFAMQ